jgi:GAF domain-containing protein
VNLLHAVAWPFLRGRYNSVGSRLNMPRPDDAPTTHAPGIDPDRILVFGNGAAVGWGVRSHDLALPGHLARRISSHTGRGTDVDVVADPLLFIRTAAGALPVSRLPAYDAVVVVIGVSDALRMTSVRHWIRGMTALLARLRENVHEGAEIVVVGISTPSHLRVFTLREGSTVDGHATRLNAATQEICSVTPGVRFVEAPEGVDHDNDDGTRSSLAPHLFRLYAATLADLLTPLLDAKFLRGRADTPSRDRVQSETERLAAIRALGILDTTHEKRFDDIVERARVLLGTSCAAFSIVDENRIWNKAIAGTTLTETPLRGAMCGVTILSNAPLVVPDVWHDDRFVTHPSVRFYAGHPVETPDGIRIGALCVTDPEPRSADSVDLVLLRELALSVQRELAQGSGTRSAALSA